MGPLIRLQVITWNPLDENGEDLERMDWYGMTMKYGWMENETEESLMDDPDVKLVPVIIEKIILPKVTGKSKHSAEQNPKSTAKSTLNQIFQNWSKRVGIHYQHLKHLN